MLIPAFTLQLNNSILTGKAVVGKCNGFLTFQLDFFSQLFFPVDGAHPALACATDGGKVFIHRYVLPEYILHATTYWLLVHTIRVMERRLQSAS